MSKYTVNHLGKLYCSFCGRDLVSDEVEHAEVNGEHFEVCGRCHNKLISKRPESLSCECDDDNECERHNEIGAQ